MGSKGLVASLAALGALLQQGIGDTIRLLLTRADADRLFQADGTLLYRAAVCADSAQRTIGNA